MVKIASKFWGIAMYLRHAAAIAASLLATIIVIDGDTVEVDGLSYRLMGFDTPETGYAKCEEERRRGIAAEDYLRRLIQTQNAELRPAGNRRDRYNRGLARLYIDGEDVAGMMIRNGHAKPYSGRGRREDWCG